MEQGGKMKKIISLFLLTSSLWALDFSTEIGVKYKSDFAASTLPISMKLTGNYSADNFYGELQVTGDEDKLDLGKVYGEIYKDKLTLTFGRQPISWGNAFIFNRLNSLTNLNMLNPNEKNTNLDGIKIKYSLNDSSRVEGMVFSINDNSDNYALRYTTLIKNYEIMANYIKKNKEGQSPAVNDIILDVKGDLLVGLWFQYAYGIDTEKSFYLLGSDYSLNLAENTLYLLWEGSYDESNSLLLNYFRYTYSFNDWTGLSGGLLLRENEKAISTTLNHKLNDNVEVNLSHIYTDSNVFKKMNNYKNSNAIEFEMKAVF